MLERLDKVLAQNGSLSRKEVKALVRKGCVLVDGQQVTAADMKIDPETASILVNGEPFQYKRFVYIMLNKPEGVVSASNSGREKTVVDLVPESLKRNGLFPAGRLDKDTTGFVLLTDDGAFAHRILSPKNHIQKTYLATLTVRPDEESLNRLRAGLELRDGTKLLPAIVERIPGTETQVEIKICEGKYHQIKRMFAAVGNPVTALQRTHMGNLALDPSLSTGECREISEEERKQIADF